MSFETLLPCPFCGGEPEEDAGGCIEYHGHEHQDYSITCKQCGAEVYCSVGTFEKADVPCSCHHDTRKVCVDKWNKRAAIIQAANSPVIPDGWIPVGERLPEVKRGFLDTTVIIAMLGEKEGGEALYCSDGKFRWGRDEDPIEDVTHWMPLPAAPQEVK